MKTKWSWILRSWETLCLTILLFGTANSAVIQESVETAKMAKKAVEEQNWEQAHDLAQSAVKLDPNSIEGLRLLFQAASRVNRSEALATASRLFEHPEVSWDEKVKILTFVQLTGDHNRFAQLYDKLSEEQRKQPDAVFLKSRFLAQRGVVGGARSVLEEYFKTGGNEARFKILLGEILVLSSDKEDQRRGQQIFSELMAGNDLNSRIAYNLLWDANPTSLIPELFPADIDSFVNALPEVRPQERLIASELKLARAKGDSAKEKEIYEDAVKAHAEKNLELLCSWLTRMQRFDLILQVVDEAKGRESGSLFDHRLRALTAVQGPEAAEKWLSNPHPNSGEQAVWVARAKLASMRKDEAGTAKAWDKALEVAMKDPKGNALLSLYRNGLEIGLVDAATRAILEGAKNPSSAFPSFSQLQPALDYLYHKGQLDDFLTLTWAALSRESNNLLLVNNFLYMSMVLDKGGNDYVAQSRKIVEARPEVPGLRSTLALALLRSGQHAEALKVLEEANADWSKETVAARAVRAVAMEKNGKKEEAASEWKALEGSFLTAAERKTFDALAGRGS